MAASSALIVIDGAHGEGGGALLRTALSMAALTQQPLRVSNIRGGTRHPGLDAEDLTIIQALADSCAAETSGADPGSNTVSFLPSRRPHGINGRLTSIRNESDRGPNALVVLNTLLPVLARCGMYCSIAIEGETHGNNALSYDAFAHMTLLAMRKIGLYAFPNLVTAGFGRESRGLVTLDVEPSALTGITWNDRGRLLRLRAVVTTAGPPSAVADRAESHLVLMSRNSGMKIEVERVAADGPASGAFITVWAEYERGLGGGAAMGGRGIRIETLAQNAFEETFGWMRLDSTLDPFLPDQLLLPLVLAEGSSTFKVSRLTQRFLTTVWVIKQFTPIHITVRGSEGGPGSVTIQH